VFSNEGTDILFIKFSIFGNGLIKNDIPLYYFLSYIKGIFLFSLKNKNLIKKEKKGKESYDNDYIKNNLTEKG